MWREGGKRFKPSRGPRRVAVDDHAIDAAIIETRRAAVHAAYASHTARWQGAQAAVLGLAALALVGWFTSTLGTLSMVGLVGVAAGALGVTFRGLRALDGEFEDSNRRLQAHFERLKVTR